MSELNTDVVVVGSGMSGLCAGIEALSHGARVVMIEKTSEPGGTTKLSGGIIWTARNYEIIRKQVPEGDPELQRVLIDNFRQDLDWLESLGASLTPELEAFEFGWGKMLTPAPPEGTANFCKQFAELFRTKGGQILLNTPMVKLTPSRDGSGVDGVVAASNKNETVNIKSKSVVLTTGGFPANPELLTRYIGPNADKLIARCNPGNTGDGFLAALELGAATSRGLHTFYGHSMAAPPAKITLDNLLLASQHYSVHGIVVNINGERFTDEGEGMDETVAQDTLTQPESKAFIILDEHIRSKYADAPTGGADELQTAIDIGCNVVTATTIDELCAKAQDKLGVDKENLSRTVSQFNMAVKEGSVSTSLSVPKSRWVNEISKPPFYCVPIAPAITFTMGGLKVNPNAQVVSRITSKPIKGLFAAGSDAGGLLYRKYLGSLSSCLVFGRLAGRNAAKRAVEK